MFILLKLCISIQLWQFHFLVFPRKQGVVYLNFFSFLVNFGWKHADLKEPVQAEIKHIPSFTLETSSLMCEWQILINTACAMFPHWLASFSYGLWV